MDNLSAGAGRPVPSETMTADDRDPAARPDTPLLERATEQGLTLAELADAFHVPPDVIAAWLIGTVPIPGEHRAHLDRILDIT